MFFKFSMLVAALASVSTGASGATIVNLSASPANPNAGPATYQSYAAPNPVVEFLSAGTYAISVAGIAEGGLYDAWTIYAPGPTAYTDGFHYEIGSGPDQRVVTSSNYGSSAAALAAYQALSPTLITLAAPTTVSFYLNDGSYPYFADDSGGVSLALSPVAAPEPASILILGLGAAGAAVARSRRAKAGSR